LDTRKIDVQEVKAPTGNSIAAFLRRLRKDRPDIHAITLGQHLRDLKGRPFRSFEEFCASPNGLGLERKEVERRLTAPELAQPETAGGVAEALPVVRAGPGRGHKTVDAGYRLPKGSNSAARIVARLKRDAPEFADRNERRNITSGQKAMAHALLFPKPHAPGRGKKKVEMTSTIFGGKASGGKKHEHSTRQVAKSVGNFSHELLRQARMVYLYSPTGRFKIALTYASTRNASSRASGSMATISAASRRS
jgi:hypothetical protein